MASDDYLCPHWVDTRYSRCVDCIDRRPRGQDFDPDRHRPVVSGPENQAAAWQPPSFRAALDSIPRADHDWQELHDSVIGAEGSLGPWVQARYHGTCPGCGFRWEPGDMIRKDEEQDAWICSACGSE